MRAVLKRMVSRLPRSWRQDLRRYYLRYQIGRRRFGADEPEFDILSSLIQPGDWVMDIGANVGHYTCAMSELVLETGRVVAVEPVPATFELLASNVMSCRFRNVTLLNVAASDRCGHSAMTIPRTSTGVENYYRAHLDHRGGSIGVLCVPLDQLVLPQPVRLVKMDVEGHEERVLRGMWSLLKRDRPI